MSNMNPRSILDPKQAFNVGLFDQIVCSFYNGNSNKEIHEILAEFERSPTAWTKAPDIIQKSQKLESKMIALSILEKCIKTRWNILPDQSKKGMKGFVESLVVKLSQDSNLSEQGVFLTKLNTVLIEIIKREWPHNWPGFITQVVEVSKRSEVVCANNMNLMRLLSEEAFENPSLHLSHQQIDDFKGNLTKELSKVFELCMFVLKNSNNPRLVACTLNTLHKFLAIQWIPIHIVFSSQLIEALTLKYYGMQQYRVSTLECLVEIANIQRKQFGDAQTAKKCNEKMVNMFLTVLKKTISECGIGLHTDINAYCRSNQYNLKFIQTLTNLLFNFLRYHHNILEDFNNGSRDGLKAALKLMLNITSVDNQTLFEISVEVWEFLVRNLKKRLPTKSLLNTRFGDKSGNKGQYEINSPLYELYKEAFHDLKQILMRRLPRPKEVLVVKDDNNNVIKQEMKDTFMLSMHKSMSQILFNLSQIDPSDTRDVIGNKLKAFSTSQEERRRRGGRHGQNGRSANEEEDVFFAELNSLCWSIGAVAGSMPSDLEKSFLVVVIKILLSLCEVQQSKNAKAIIASCIMYVVRKYPRFLKRHWKFLQTVVRKLIEFLAEKHPGVQDMSIETLNEICIECGQKFLKLQENDKQIFFDELIAGLHAMCSKLDYEQIENLFATWAQVICHEKNKKRASDFVAKLLGVQNQRYRDLMNRCNQNTQSAFGGNSNGFRDEDTISKFVHLLRINKGVCSRASGPKSRRNGAFLLQFTEMFQTLLALYTGYAQLMNGWYTANEGVPRSAAPEVIKKMSTLKAEILQLFEEFVTGSMACDHEEIAHKFVPSLLDAMLADYQNCSAKYREYCCLNVCSALMEQLDSLMDSFIPKMFGTLFQITLDMIKESMDNFPDHRAAFFKFLHNVCKHNFAVFEQMNKTQMQLVINCIMWAHEHIDHSITEYGIKTLDEFLNHIRALTAKNGNGALMTMFYSNFGLVVLEKLLHVMTDTLHKASFAEMCATLKTICHDLSNNQFLGNIFPPDQGANSNVEFVASRLSAFLQREFQHLTEEVTRQFLIGLFKLADSKPVRSPTKNANVLNAATQSTATDPYVQHCEDFLVAIRSVHRSAASSNNNSQPPPNVANGTPNGGSPRRMANGTQLPDDDDL